MKKERSNRLPGFLEKSFWFNYSGVIAGIVLVAAVGLILYWPQITREKSLANLFSATRSSGTANKSETKAPQAPDLLQGKQGGTTEQTLTPATREAKEGTEKSSFLPEPSKLEAQLPMLRRQDKMAPQQLSPPLPATSNDGVGRNSISIVAVRGQGITHLARFALQRYLNEQKPKVTLTKEHKIFIEDFLKDRVKKIKIHPESELTFPLDLINKAIMASQNLTPAQLHNLTRYSNRVPSLSAYTPIT